MVLAKGYTDGGGRQYNEDTYVFGWEKNIFYAVMADGLGGHGSGDLASMAAVQVVEECLKQRNTTEKLTEEEMNFWFSKANERVLSIQTKECQMKTTMAVLCIDEIKSIALMAHLGDSRIYHFIDGKYVSCTFDHSVSRMAVLAGEIKLNEVRFHEDRNKLLKVIGKPSDVNAETETIILSTESSHAFLLCTDGFWEYVTEGEMEKDLAEAVSPEEWLIKMRSKLIKRAKKENDNNSAIAVFIRG